MGDYQRHNSRGFFRLGGRIDRTAFLLRTIFLGVLFGLFPYLALRLLAWEGCSAALPIMIFAIVFCIAFVGGNIALGVRRFHDIGLSGWPMLVIWGAPIVQVIWFRETLTEPVIRFESIIGTVMFLFLLLSPGEEKANPYSEIVMPEELEPIGKEVNFWINALVVGLLCVGVYYLVNKRQIDEQHARQEELAQKLADGSLKEGDIHSREDVLLLLQAAFSQKIKERAAAEAGAQNSEAAATPAVSASAAYTPGEWLTNFDRAVAIAQQVHKPILADFTGSDWCIWCKRLDGEVFSTLSFNRWAREHVVLLKVDFPQNIPQDLATKAANQKLMSKFGVQGFPTVILLKEDGTEKARTGYQQGGAAAYIQRLEGLLK